MFMRVLQWQASKYHLRSRKLLVLFYSIFLVAFNFCCCRCCCLCLVFYKYILVFIFRQQNEIKKSKRFWHNLIWNTCVSGKWWQKHHLHWIKSVSPTLCNNFVWYRVCVAHKIYYIEWNWKIILFIFDVDVCMNSNNTARCINTRQRKTTCLTWVN